MLHRPIFIAVLLGAAAIHFSFLFVIHTTPPATGRSGRALTAFLAMAGLYLVSIATIKLFAGSVWFGVLRTENFLALIAYRASLVHLMVDVAGIRRHRRVIHLLIYGTAAILAVLVIGDVPHWFSLAQFRQFSAGLKEQLFHQYWVAVWAEGGLNVAALAPLAWYLNRTWGNDRRRRLVKLLAAAMLLMIANFALQAFAERLFVRGGPVLSLACEISSVLVTILIAYFEYRYLFVSRFLRCGIAMAVATFCSALAGTLMMSNQVAPGLVAVYTCAIALGTAWAASWIMGLFLLPQDRAARMRQQALTLMASAPAVSAGTALAEVLRWGFDAAFAEYTPEGEAAPLRSDVRLAIPIRSGARSFGIIRLGARRHDAPYESYDADWLRSLAGQLATMLERDEEAQRAHEMRELAARAENSALRAQIQPHFLFNSLNTLAEMIKSEPAIAERLVEKMSDIFRYALAASRTEAVSVSEEVEFVSAYLEIEKARFHDRLTVDIAVAKGAAATRIPPMTLQPIVENAIRHGIARSRLGGRVTVRAEDVAGRVRIEVLDTASTEDLQEDRPGLGIAMENVKKRLALMYDGAASLTLAASERGTRVTIEVPM
ncbi:MAG TPA: histidine kinase [Thermoanaerobaculia bacterium]|nr:histidine kinase [Thermoanaerobaculia bacterium]